MAATHGNDMVNRQGNEEQDSDGGVPLACSSFSLCSTLTLKNTTDPYLNTAMYLSLADCAT
jgi:hypothetical protein